MTPETFIKAQLAAVAHREGGHCGGVKNMVAVAQVMRNRQRAGWHGGDWMAILNSAEQTAPRICRGIAPNLRGMEFRLLLQQIDDIYDGTATDILTEGGLYYAELHDIENEWFLKNIARDHDNHPRVAQVGQTVFFK